MNENNAFLELEKLILDFKGMSLENDALKKSIDILRSENLQLEKNIIDLKNDIFETTKKNRSLEIENVDLRSEISKEKKSNISKLDRYNINYNKVLNIIKNYTVNNLRLPITRWQLSRKTQFLDREERDMIIKDLISTGVIEAISQDEIKTGRPVISYRIKRE